MDPSSCNVAFYGTTTVGERGQIVIPAEARADLNINAGEKLLVMRHPKGDGLMIFKLSDARAVLDHFSRMMQHVESLVEKGEDV